MTGLFKNKEKQVQRVVLIETSLIIPNRSQPRVTFSDEELSSLADSIRENGILQPINVRKCGVNYEIVSGERRLRAAKLCGLESVPCIIIDVDDEKSAVLALIENIQRRDLSYFEEAVAIEKLISYYGLTQEEAAQRLGKTQSTIANKLRLLRLTYEEQELIISAGLTERHARALLRIEDEGKRREVLSKIIALNLNTQQTDNLVGEVLNDCPKHIKSMGSSKAVIKDVRIFVNTINKAVDTMRLAGIDAKAVKSENNNYIEYTIKIPKKTASDNKSA